MSRYYEEIARIAALRGIRTEEKADCLYLEMDDSCLCEVMENGSVRYRKSDTDTPARSRMLHDIIEDAELAREYVSAMEAAPFLKASGLAEEKFKLLLDYGGYLLAGQDRGAARIPVRHLGMELESYRSGNRKLLGGWLSRR